MLDLYGLLTALPKTEELEDSEVAGAMEDIEITGAREPTELELKGKTSGTASGLITLNAIVIPPIELDDSTIRENLGGTRRDHRSRSLQSQQTGETASDSNKREVKKQGRKKWQMKMESRQQRPDARNGTSPSGTPQTVDSNTASSLWRVENMGNMGNVDESSAPNVNDVDMAMEMDIEGETGVKNKAMSSEVEGKISRTADDDVGPARSSEERATKKAKTSAR